MDPKQYAQHTAVTAIFTHIMTDEGNIPIMKYEVSSTRDHILAGQMVHGGTCHYNGHDWNIDRNDGRVKLYRIDGNGVSVTAYLPETWSVIEATNTDSQCEPDEACDECAAEAIPGEDPSTRRWGHFNERERKIIRCALTEGRYTSRQFELVARRLIGEIDTPAP